MALTGIMVTYPVGISITTGAKRMLNMFKEYVGRGELNRLGHWESTYKMYKPYSIEALSRDACDFADNEQLTRLERILTLQDKSEDYKAITMRNGMVVAYAEGEVGECLRTALALGLGPMLNIRESNDY